MLDNRGMAEWVKIIVGVCSGLMVGLIVGVVGAIFVEPLKQRRLRQERATKAREEIYRELSHLYYVFVQMDEDTVADPQTFLEERIRYLKLDAYDYYYNQQRETFYDISDWIALKNMVERLGEIRYEMVENHQDAETAVQDVIMAFTTSYQSRELDSKMLMKYSDISAV